MSNQTELNKGKTSISVKPDFSKTPLNYPEPDSRLKSKKISDYFAFLGPGLILASCGIGTGEIFFSSQMGAIFGYAMIWTFLLSVVFKGFAIWSGSRYITITGESPVRRWGQIFPGPKNWFPFLIGLFSILSFPTWGAGFAKAMGQWSIWVFGFGNPLVWATVWILIVVALNFVSTYDLVEKVNTWVVLFMVALVIVAVFVSKPDWLGILAGFIPSIPDSYAGWVAQKYPATAAKPISLVIISCLGSLGGGTYDYVGYLGLYREKKWGMLGNPNIEEIEQKLFQIHKGDMIPLEESETEVSKAKAWLRATNIDAFVSFASVFIFGVAFLILGAVILQPQNVIPNDNEILRYQAKFLTQISPILVYAYQLGVFGALFGTMYGCSSELYVWTFKESWGPCFKVVRDMNFKTARNIELAFYAGGALILMWTGVSFTTLVSFGSIFGGVLSTGLWALAMLYTEKKFLPKAYHMSGFAKFMVAISGIVLTSMGVVAVLQFFKLI
jgi:hypothetical protein